jgi:hypothetical protein
MEGYKYTSPGATAGSNFARSASPLIVPLIPDHHKESFGQNSEEGIIPRAIKGLFERVEQVREQTEGTRKITVSCSYI